MNLAHRRNYYRRIFPGYLGRSNSHLTFGHDSPDINYRFAPRSLGPGLAFEARQKETSEGGMVHLDERGDPWLEEYIVSPPTHILNGFIRATWGVYDYWLATGEEAARQLFGATISTLRRNLEKYDAGFWSLYDLAGTRLKMLASPFYHRLHVAQFGVLHRLTGEELFAQYAEKWDGYRRTS